MGWGDIFSQPGIVSSVANAFGVPEGVTDLLTGGAQAYQLAKSTKASNKATSDYAGALESQRTAGAELSATSRRMMEEDAALRQRLLEQTGTLGARLQSVYDQLGPLPAINPATIAADYGALRAQSMDDFANLVKSFTASQGAQNSAQLGGARNPALEDYQLNQNIRKFAPVQQQLDTAAYAEAVNRANQQGTALSTNRNQILQNIVATLSPQLTAESGLYQPGVTAGVASNAANIGTQYLESAKPLEQTLAKQSQTDLGNLQATIQKIFGGGSTPAPGPITWEDNFSVSGAPAAAPAPVTAAPRTTTAPTSSVIPGGYTPAPTQTARPYWEVENRAFAPIPGFK